MIIFLVLLCCLLALTPNLCSSLSHPFSVFKCCISKRLLPCYLLETNMKNPPSPANLTSQFRGRNWVVYTWHNLFLFKLWDSESPSGPGLNIWKLLLCLSKSWQVSGFRTCQQYVKLYQLLRLWEWWRLPYSFSSQILIHTKSASSNKNSFPESSKIHGNWNWKWLRSANHITTFHL